MSRFEYDFSKENDRRKAESEEKNTGAVDESIAYYEKTVQNLIDSNKSLTDQQFQELEETIKTKSRRIFREKCCSGDLKFISKFDNIFRERISQLKYDFKEQLRRQREKVIVGIEIDLIDLSEGLNELAQTFNSEEEFDQETLKIKEKFTDKMKLHSLSEELTQSFVKKLDSIVSENCGRLLMSKDKRQEALHRNSYFLLEAAKSLYIKVIDL